MAGVCTGRQERFTDLQNWLGSSQDCRKRELQLAAPKAVVLSLLLAILVVLLCAGDIESNPGPWDKPHPSLKKLHSQLEKAIGLLKQIFGGSATESYLSTAMVLAGADLTEAMMHLNADFRELGSEEDRKQLQAEFLAHIDENFEVLHLFYKLPKALFLGKLCIMCFQHFLWRLFMFLN